MAIKLSLEDAGTLTLIPHCKTLLCPGAILSMGFEPDRARGPQLRLANSGNGSGGSYGSPLLVLRVTRPAPAVVPAV